MEIVARAEKVGKNCTAPTKSIPADKWTHVKVKAANLADNTSGKKAKGDTFKNLVFMFGIANKDVEGGPYAKIDNFVIKSWPEGQSPIEAGIEITTENKK